MIINNNGILNSKYFSIILELIVLLLKIVYLIYFQKDVVKFKNIFLLIV